MTLPILTAVVFAWLMYIMYRNGRVCKFRVSIINQPGSNWHELVRKHHYVKMLLIPKPLKLKYWFTKEEIEILTRS